MELHCPRCASPEVEPDPDGSADDRICENCDARFLRASCLVTVAAAESAAAIQICAPATPDPFAGFRYDARRGRRQLLDPDGSLWPVNAFSDADEVHSLVAAALECDVINHCDPRATLYVHPLALAEPDPLLAVDSGAHPTVLSHSLRLYEREGEDPVEFTLRLLKEVVDEANQLLSGLDAYHRDLAK